MTDQERQRVVNDSGEDKMTSGDRERLAQLLNDYNYTTYYTPKENGIFDGRIILTDEAARARARQTTKSRIESASSNLIWIDSIGEYAAKVDKDLKDNLSALRRTLIERDQTIKTLNDQVATIKNGLKEIIN